MILRRAKQEDKEALWQIQTQSIRQQGTSHYNSEQIEAWAGGLTPEDSYNRAMESQSIEQGKVIVAEDTDGILVGFASLDKQSGEVGAVYVLTSHIRRGIGRQLFETLEEEARRFGVVELHVRASLNAVAFYERVGFKYEHEAPHRFRSGVEIPCAVMTKVL